MIHLGTIIMYECRNDVAMKIMFVYMSLADVHFTLCFIQAYDYVGIAIDHDILGVDRHTCIIMHILMD